MQARGFLDADPTDSVQHGMPNGHIPGLNVRLSSYITVLVEEWLLACVVWRAMRDRGVPLASLVGGSWRTPGALVRDIGLAMAFTVLVVPLGSSLMYSIGGNGAVLIDLVPHTGFELALWLMLSASAGFCEELIFRGYILK